MLRLRSFKKFEKAVSILSVFFFLSAQPLYAAPLFEEEENLTTDEQNQAGFVDATQAEQSYQNQLNEVERMKSLLDETANALLNDGKQDPSILTKFQNTDGKTDSTLAEAAVEQDLIGKELSTEKLNSEIDLAMLQLEMAPEVSPIFIEPVPIAQLPAPEENLEAQSTEPTDSQQLLADQDKIQAVPQAELGLTGTLFVQSESQEDTQQISSQEPVQLAQQTAEPISESSSAENTQNSSFASLDAVVEEPTDLAGMTAPATEPTTESEPTLLVSAETIAPASPADSTGTAMELAALMTVDQSLDPASTTQVMDVETYSLMGSLTPEIQNSSQIDPPLFIFPIPPPTTPIDFTIPDPEEGEPESDNVGGIPLFGDGETFLDRLLNAIRMMLFEDKNHPTGKFDANGNPTFVGDGVNDAVTRLSKFMVVYFRFFGFSFKVGELRDLILRGTGADGMELFGISEEGIEPIVPIMMFFTAFILATSAFFQEDASAPKPKGLDIDDIRSRKADAFSLYLPIIISNELLISLGKFLDPTLKTPHPTLTNAQVNAQANLVARNAILSSLLSAIFGITLSIRTPTDGKPIKLFNFDPNKDFDPSDPKQLREFSSDQTLNLTLPPEALQFFFPTLEGAPPEIQALLQALNNGVATPTGMFGIMKIDLSAIVNQIGEYLVKSMQSQLGDLLRYYESLGSPTGMRAGLPTPSLPLLLMMGFAFRTGAGSDPSIFNDPTFFAQTLAIPLLFMLSRPPIPSIMNPDSSNPFNANYNKLEQNAAENFEDQAKAKKAEAEGAFKGKGVEKKKPAKKPAKKPGKK